MVAAAVGMKFGEYLTEHRIPEWSRAYVDYAGLKMVLEALAEAKARRKAMDVEAGGGGDDEAMGVALALESSPAVDERGKAKSFRGGSMMKVKNLAQTATVIARWQIKAGQRGGDGKPLEGFWVEDDDPASPGEQTTASTSARLRTELVGDGIGCPEEETAFFAQLDVEVTKVNQFYSQQEGAFLKRHRDLLWQVDELGRRREEIRVAKEKQEELRKAVRDAEISSKGVTVTGKAKLYVLGRLNAEGSERWRKLMEAKEQLSRNRNSVSGKERALKGHEKAVKDGFRGFMKGIYMLDAYRTLNMQAFEKILKKHDKIARWNAGAVYLGIVNKAHFSVSTEIKHLKAESEAAYRKEFAGGDERRMRSDLLPQARQVNIVRVLLAGVFVGIAVQCVLGLILTMSFVSSDDRLAYYGSLLPIFRGIGLLALHVAMFGANIGQWEICSINYPFIFNLNETRVLPGESVELAGAVILAFVLFVAVVLSKLYSAESANGEPLFGTADEIFGHALLTMRIVWIFVILLSFGMFRWLRRTAWRILFSGTTEVVIGDFFTADQLTSQTQMLKDLVYLCAATPSNRLDLHGGSINYQGAVLGVCLMPFYFRFMQCMRRWRDRNNKMDLVNGGKYASSLLAVTLGFAGWPAALRWPAIAAKVLATEYALTWDLYVDWGLMRNPLQGQFLRPELWLSRKWPYYVAIALDVLLRHVWVLPLSIGAMHYRSGTFANECWLALAGTLEVLRRSMWNFLRIENEHLHNVEGYRAVNFVPLPFGERQAHAD